MGNGPVRLSKDRHITQSPPSSHSKKVLKVISPSPGVEFLLLEFHGGYTNSNYRNWLQPGWTTIIPAILIPVSREDWEACSVTTDILRIKSQGSSRSYSGQTNVENLQIFGESVLNYSPTRARVAFEKKRQYSRLGQVRCIANATGYCGLGTDVPKLVQEQFDCYKIMSSNTLVYRQIIGMGRSGTIEWSQYFENSHVLRKATITWKLSKGVVSLDVQHVVDDPDDMLDTYNVKRVYPSLYRNWYFYGHYYGDFPVSQFPPMNSNTVKLSPISGFYTYEYHERDWVRHRVDAPRWTFRLTLGRTEWYDQDSSESSSLDLLPMLESYAKSDRFCMKEFESVRDYQVGRSPLGQFDTGYFQLPHAFKAKNRGGQSVFSEMQEEAINQNRYINTNLWMFIQDLANAQEDWANLYNQFKADGEFISVLRRERKGSLKEGAQLGANTFLPLLYGWRLTQSEAEKLGEQIARLQDECRLAEEDRYLGPMRRQEILEEIPDELSFLTKASQVFAWSATVRPEPNAFSSAFAFLDERSVTLTMSDAWDWVPYSFVVNWFDSTVGDMAQRLDFRAWKANYFPLEVTRSYRLEASADLCKMLSLVNWQTVVPAQIKYYWRDVNKKLDPPGFHSSEDSASSRLASHWCEASALIVQRL